MQEIRNSIGNALELRLPCTNPLSVSISWSLLVNILAISYAVVYLKHEGPPLKNLLSVGGTHKKHEGQCGKL